MVMTILSALYRFFADISEVVRDAHKMRAAAALRYPGLMASE